MKKLVCMLLGLVLALSSTAFAAELNAPGEFPVTNDADATVPSAPYRMHRTCAIPLSAVYKRHHLRWHSTQIPQYKYYLPHLPAWNRFHRRPH